MGKPEFVVDRERLEVVQTQELDAPRERVWELMTDPELIPQWWGPAVMKTTVEKMDVREGGSWRYIHRDPEGQEHVFSGEYFVVRPPEYMEHSMAYENMPGDVMHETTTLEELPGGGTRLVIRSRFQSPEVFDDAVGSGMEEGATESLVRFEELLKKQG
jgi:uncharacterized protein YndB with AHSA1/START domain